MLTTLKSWATRQKSTQIKVKIFEDMFEIPNFVLP